jgi:glutathione S-transferase
MKPPMKKPTLPTVYHIPVCPFSQRLEILLELKGMRSRIDFRVVDITTPRPADLLAKTRGSTALPILEDEEGRVVRESLVILHYLEERFPDPPVLQGDPYRRAVENMLIAMEGEFTAAGYRYVMNQDPGRRKSLEDAVRAQFARLSEFLEQHEPRGVWLFDRFGFAETVFAPIFMRFWFLEYYEGFELPEMQFARVLRWRDSCRAHPAAQQVTLEEIVKLYYDYAQGAGDGALLPGRTRSSFVFEPHWSRRPWPPREKYGRRATDHELGLLEHRASR